MWASGYRPSKAYEPLFERLAVGAVPTAASPKEAVATVIKDRSDNPSRAVRAQSDAMVAEARVRRDSEPTMVTFDGNVWTIKKEFVIHRPIEEVTELLDPVNWQRLSPFFKQTQRIEPSKAISPKESWSGTLKETLLLNWNIITLQRYDVLLKIDYTVASDVVRADYSLKYEYYNQILVDDGYAEARRESSERTHYTGYKRLRFASSFVNLVAPAVLCMLLENDEDGLRGILEREAAAGAPNAQPVTDTVKRKQR